MSNGVTNGWNEWGRHVLAELKRNEREHKEMLDRVDKFGQRLTEQKVKLAGLAGGISILMAILVSVIVRLVT